MQHGVGAEAAHLLEEFLVLRGRVLDVLEDLDRHVLPAIAAPIQVAKGPRGDPAQDGQLRGVQLPVVHGSSSGSSRSRSGGCDASGDGPRPCCCVWCSGRRLLQVPRRGTAAARDLHRLTPRCEQGHSPRRRRQSDGRMQASWRQPASSSHAPETGSSPEAVRPVVPRSSESSSPSSWPAPGRCR